MKNNNACHRYFLTFCTNHRRPFFTAPLAVQFVREHIVRAARDCKRFIARAKGAEWCGQRMPIAHAEGNFVCDDATLAELQREDRIIFRYCDRDGQDTDEANPNGSRDNIAGICNRERNVLGLMPHPERACEDLLGSSDGSSLFSSLAGTLAAA